MWSDHWRPQTGACWANTYMEYSAVPCGPLFFPATHSAALFVSPRRLFFSVNELLLQFLCMYLFFPPLCPEPSQHVHTLLLLRFFVFAIKDTSTGISWCSTGLPSLFFLSWFNLKSELCSPLYLISSLPVSPLSRSVLSLSVGVQYNDWWMQKRLFFSQSAVTHRKAREQERCAWPFHSVRFDVSRNVRWERRPLSDRVVKTLMQMYTC